jgi:hypothetical protein
MLWDRQGKRKICKVSEVGASYSNFKCNERRGRAFLETFCY